MEQTVQSEWPTRGNSKIALIGEAPSDEEVEQRRPFVGPAGKILDAMLRSAQIDRLSCFVGNVFTCKLVDNSTIETRKALGEKAYKALWESSLERLKEELEDYSPHVVVALGGTAALALVGNAGVTKLRGQVMMGAPPFHKLKVLPTYHPAFILRQIKHYTIGIMDLVKADAEARKGPKIVYPKRELILKPTIEEVEHYLHEWRKTDLLSVDIETGWNLIRGVSFAPSQEVAMYVPFISLDTWDKNYWGSLAEEIRAWKAVKGILESPVPKLGQNFTGYDAVWLFKQAGIRVMNLRHDTRLLHHVLYAELPKSLAFMGASYSTQGAWKHWADHHGGFRKKDKQEKRDE